MVGGAGQVGPARARRGGRAHSRRRCGDVPGPPGHRRDRIRKFVDPDARAGGNRRATGASRRWGGRDALPLWTLNRSDYAALKTTGTDVLVGRRPGRWCARLLGRPRAAASTLRGRLWTARQVL